MKILIDRVAPQGAVEVPAYPTASQGRLSTATSYLIKSSPTEYFNAMTDGLLANRCHNDNAQDDLAHLIAQAAAAKAAGKALYLPAGAGYRITSAWSLPTYLTMFGDGVSSHIMGQVRMNTGCDVSDLFIGVSSDKALGFYTSSLMTNMAFSNCRFRGGTWNAVVQETNAYQKFNGLTFTDCTFECSYFIEPWSMAHQEAHSVSLQTDRAYSKSIMDNLTFDHCHFGATNEYGQSENMYGNILFYSHGTDYMDATTYCDNLTVKNCLFEKTWNWGIDYAMNAVETSDPRVYDLQYCTFICTDNLFKGCGGHRSETSADFPIALDLEPVYNASITGNVFYRCSYEAVKFTFDCRYSVCEDNIFDYRIDNGIYDQVGAGTWSDRWVYRILWINGGDHNSAIDNHLYLPSSYSSRDTDDWIVDEGDSSTISGNDVTFNDTQVDWESVMDVGPRT